MPRFTKIPSRRGYYDPPTYKPRRRRRSHRKAKSKYLQYLHSPYWIAFRKFVINERGSQCEMCGLMGAVQVHHLSYERIGRELPIDVQLLCRSCHTAEHGITRRK
jgi:5-methylcytosine-specific restriction endonuclease McrA